MIVIVMGVVGAGKTTIGKLLASEPGWEFADADDFHPIANVEKIRHGIALTDEDREPWLERLRKAITVWIAAGKNIALACSALKRSYRDYLRRDRPDVKIVLIDVDQATLTARLAGRHGHFFPRKLLQSQLADLEMPAPDEHVLVVPATGTPAQMAGKIIGDLDLPPSAG